MTKRCTLMMWVLLLAVLPLGCRQAEAGGAAAEASADSVSVVYFTSRISADAVSQIYEKLAGELQGRIAFKVHFGEEDNQNFLSPELIKPLCLRLNATLVETNTLYGDQRSNTASHIALAKRHGFGFAPIDILDSEGNLAYDHKSAHFSKIYTGSHFPNYDSYLIYSHFKGHGSAGFGGAIKNVAMGLASREGKRFMHRGNYPIYDESKCIECNICVTSCPESAISIRPVNIDHTACIACGKCISVCPVGVFSQPVARNTSEAFMERLVDYAHALSKERKMVYINVLANISRSCDCIPGAPKPFVKDIGILASTDIVAIEAASHDLVDKAHNCDDAFLKVNSVSGKHQIRYAHSLGMGNIRYRLVDIDKR